MGWNGMARHGLFALGSDWIGRSTPHTHPLHGVFPISTMLVGHIAPRIFGVVLALRIEHGADESSTLHTAQHSTAQRSIANLIVISTSRSNR